MITISNYTTETKNIDFSKMPTALQQAHDKADSFLEFYNESDDIKEVFDLYLVKLNAYLNDQKKPSKAKTKKPTKSTTTKKPKATINKEKKPSKAPSKAPKKASRKKVVKDIKDIIQNEHYTHDIRIIKRFVNCIEKEKPKRTILNIFRDLQKQVVNRTIRKTDKNAMLIKELTNRLECALNNANINKFKMLRLRQNDDNKELFEQLREMAKTNKRRKSVLLLNRFIGIYGDTEVNKDKVKRLYTAINTAFDKNQIDKNDPYFSNLKVAHQHVKDFLENKTDRVKIATSQLSGVKKKANAINEKFNSDLNLYINNKHKGNYFNLGLPSKILKNAGLDGNVSIKLLKRTLTLKINKHGFNPKLLLNLPNKLANPIFVFNSKITDEKRFGISKIVVIGGKVINEGVLTVIITKDKYNNLIINKVDSIHGRDIKQLWNYINEGLMLYNCKNKSPVHLAEAFIASHINDAHDFYYKKINLFFDNMSYKYLRQDKDKQKNNTTKKNNKKTLEGTAQHPDTIAFNKQILQAKRKGIKQLDIFKLGKARGILKNHIGSNDIIMSGKVVKKAMLKDNDHIMTWENFINLPDYITCPIAIFESDTITQAKIVLTEIKNYKEKPLMVALHINEQLNISKIASIYSKRQISIYLKWIDRGLCEYLNKKAFYELLPGPIPLSHTIKGQHKDKQKNNTTKKNTKKNTKKILLGNNKRIEVDLSDFEKSSNAPSNAPSKTPSNAPKNKTKSNLFQNISLLDNNISATERLELQGDLGKFLGYVERYEYSVLLRGDKGAGKTRMLFQMMNLFATHNFKVGCFSLEIGKHSNLLKDMRNEYINTSYIHNISIADECPNGFDDIKQAANQFDVVCIDSWGKIGDIKIDNFNLLRKKYPKTIFIVIFQSTTNKTARGGSMPEYDAGIVIQVQNGGIAICEKNRYNGEQYEYSVFEQKLINTTT